MKLVSETDDILFKTLEPFDFSNPPTDPVQLAIDMIKFMQENDGVGMSANQVGLPYRVFVMEGSPPFACFNPRIVDMADTNIELVEGCLSYPDLWIKVKRPEWVRMRFQTPTGDTTTLLFSGYHARVALHEIDHLNGKSYTWLARPHELVRARKKQKLLRKGKATYVKKD